jgi:ATP-dependent Clp protease ATP-binding subunit ClpA
MRSGRHVEPATDNLTIEHLLLAILEAPGVCETLRACRCDFVKLKQELKERLDQPRPWLDQVEERELPSTLPMQPTASLQRVLQRARTSRAWTW